MDNKLFAKRETSPFGSRRPFVVFVLLASSLFYSTITPSRGGGRGGGEFIKRHHARGRYSSL
ncbi:MAG: hypothetical protein M3114_02890 [Thermoproteota archaeon]|nr:hypothetical protein [Thermoproteota archaeon]